jgi:hypothetical protein
MKASHAIPGGFFRVLAAAAVIFCQAGCRSLLTIPGQWLEIPGRADGRLEDFTKMITSRLFEDGMMVGVGNDDRFLFIFFSPDVRHRQRQGGRASLTIWLDETGARAKRLGLVHTSGAGRFQPPEDGVRQPEQKELAREGTGPPPLPPATELLTIVDRKSGKETIINADGSLGPAVRLSSDWGDFAYQWRIPFQAQGDWPGLVLHPGKSLGIGLLWQIQPRPGPAGAGPDRPRPGEGRGGPGGPPPGMSGGPGNGMAAQNLKARRQVWLKITLVEKK